MRRSEQRASTGERQCWSFNIGNGSATRLIRVLDPRDVVVSCSLGKIWITQLGDQEDYVLIPGESRAFRGRGSLVIHPLEPSSCSVACKPQGSWGLRLEQATAVIHPAVLGMSQLASLVGLTVSR